MTITEALAEIKLIDAKIAKKRSSIMPYLVRPEHMTDALEKSGGSKKYIAEERQSINDLERRKVSLRLAIAEANARTELTIAGESKSIAEWIVWRREVSSGKLTELNQLRSTIDTYRRQYQTQQRTIVDNGASVQVPVNAIVAVDEVTLIREAEKLQEILDTLDGQLSLKNATTSVALV